MSFHQHQPLYFVAPPTDLHPADQGRYRLHQFNCGHKVLLPVSLPCAANCVKPLVYPPTPGYYFDTQAACNPPFCNPYLKQSMPPGFISPLSDTHWVCAVCEPERRRLEAQEAARLREEEEEAKMEEARRKAEEEMLRYHEMQIKMAEEARKKAEEEAEKATKEEAKQEAVEEAWKHKEVPESRDEWECDICGLGCFCYHLPGDEWIDAPDLPKVPAPENPGPVNQPQPATVSGCSEALHSDAANSVRASTPSQFETPVLANAVPLNIIHPQDTATSLQSRAFDPPKGPSNTKWHANQRYSEKKMKEHHQRRSYGGHRGYFGP